MISATYNERTWAYTGTRRRRRYVELTVLVTVSTLCVNLALAAESQDSHNPKALWHADRT